MPVRDRADACPGALSTHTAADGELARIRVPGGRLTCAGLEALASAAREFSDGSLHLTARSNVQVRSLSQVASFGSALDAAGLLGPASHERVRNVLASPLSGIRGGLVDVGPLVTALDRAICASPELTGLPGRFLFGLDDGRGDVADPADDRVDVCWRATDGDRGVVLLAGRSTGVLIPREVAASALVAVAERYVQVGDGAWQVRELDASRHHALQAAVERRGRRAEGPVQCTMRAEGSLQLPGVIEREDGGHAVVAGVPFGVLTADQATLIAGLCDAVVLTPWRSVVLPAVNDADAAAKALVSAGLAIDPDAPGQRITACIGSPGCARSRADVRADATRVMPARARQAHFAGCERRCGRPPGAVDVLADEDGGYRVDGAWVAVDELTEVLRERS